MPQPRLNSDPILKVTVFAIVGGRVLVFDHPLAGTQFPAGTVDPGETPADAAVRELREETGVRVDDVELLGTSLTAREDDLAYTLQAIMADDGLRIPSGYRVHVLGTHGEAVRFTRRDYDYSTVEPEILSDSPGTTSTQNLTRFVERHFYRTHVQDAVAWSWEGDDGHVWRCHFVEIGEVLAFGEQQGWIDQFASQLLPAN